jgi:hypothetical protein
VEKFKALQASISEHNFEDLVDDKDLQLRMCAGIIAGETTPQVIMALQGAEIRKSFGKIEQGILGALDFLKREANVRHYKMIPFPGLLVPLAAFFATDSVEGFRYTTRQREKLLRWFWRTLFTRRFSAGVNRRQASDIAELLRLKENEDYEIRLPSAEIRIDFKQSPFSSGSANGRVLILLLNSMMPRSFLSGANIDLDEVLKKGSKHEYHHIFPQKHLERLGLERKMINVLSNICFLTRSDNNKIKDRTPHEYLADIPEERRPEYLYSALCPEDISGLDYSEFLEKRAILLEKRAMELMA